MRLRARALRVASRAFVACGVVLCAVTAPAGTLALRDVGLALEQAKAAARAGRAPDGEALRAVLARLEAEDAHRQRSFVDAISRGLPADAASRLERARAAYAVGQGRLLEVVRAAVGARPGPAQDAMLEEALRLHAAIESASASVPVSAGPRIRPPRIVAPPLPPAGSAAAPDTPDAPDAPEAPVIGAVPGALLAAASALPGPIEVFEWVRNEMRPEFYHGGMKGALAAFEERNGNDADTAAVLVEMLRAKGVPARYARGVIEVPAPTLAALTGAASVPLALRVLERAGIPHEAVAGPGGTAAVRMHRVWVEAYLPYANYRGAVIDTQGSVWLSLDAAFKPMASPVGLDVVGALGFDPRQALDEYLSSVHSVTPREFVRGQVVERLALQLPGTAYDDVLNRRTFEVQRLGLLPSTLPYKVVSLSGVAYDLDEDLRHRVRVVGEDTEGAFLDVTVDAADILGRRVTLAYEPDSEADRNVVALYGGLHLTPPYLIKVRPVLKVAGLPVGSGSRGIGMAVRYALRLELATPGGTETVSNQVTAGNLIAIGFSGRSPGAPESQAMQADQILSALATRYFELWNASDEELADLLRVVPVRPTLSACFAMSDVEVEYAGGDPLYPLTFEWKGILIDADLRAAAPVGVETPEAEARFLLLSGLEGSALEDRVFAQDLHIAAVSTAQVLGLATAQGLDLRDVTRENVDDVLAELPFDSSVEEEIRDSALSGMLVRVPSGLVTRQAWRGVGYLMLDEETGESAWQLQGGHSGGVTTPAVIEIPAEISDPLIAQGQSIPPAPADAEVRFVQKFVSTDFQDGTVDFPLDKPLRVLVTDEEGRAVRDAHVTFSVIGGGSLLQDPATGGLPAAEVTVRSNEQGEAEALLLLGKRTDVIPRLLLFPGTPQEPLQVGLNLVTVRAGSATLSEPFTAIALPDYQMNEDTGTAFGYFEWQPVPVQPPLSQLSVAGRMAVWVRDQHGNPLSNILVRFTYRPPPIQMPPPEGMSLTRPATTTPGRVLTTAAYQQCLAVHLQPHYGECEGEESSVLVRSTHLGAFAYAVIGDSPWSAYYFDLATDLQPLGWTAYATSAYVCAFPDVSQCEGSQAPYEPYVVTGLRPVRVNRLGNFTEAYAPDGEGLFRMWADAVSEKERVTRVVDPDGTEHFIPTGTNEWRRERLLDSEVHLRPETEGTGVSPEVATPLGDGTYESQVRMALTPQLNRVRFDAKHWPLRLVYREGVWPLELDPAHVNAVTLEAERIRFPDVPAQTAGHFELWGIAPRLTGLAPTPVRVGPEGTVSEASDVSAQVEPEAYRALLAPEDILFELRRDGVPVLAANGVSGSYQVPVGLPFPASLHEAQLSVVGVSQAPQGYQDVVSEPLPLPRCALLDLATPFVSIPLAVDVVNGTQCGNDGLLKFTLCEASRVTLRVEGQAFEGKVLGLPGPHPPETVRVEDLELPAGDYTVVFPQTYLGPNVLAQKPFVLGAVSLDDPSRHEEAPGTVANSARNRAVLPVGHTFVKGVDLFDGHLVRSHADLEIPGRNIGLTVQRSYTSAGADRSGLLGAGWAFSYESSLFVTECGVIVQTADGSSQMFRSTDGGETFVPQKGYHTRLRRNQDESFDFFDKASNRHHFAEPSQPQAPEGNRRLQYIEEPHGDRIVLVYDATPRLIHVREVQAESGSVRQLDVSYEKKGGFDRISRIAAPALGLAVDYRYDEFGNLLDVRRNGPPPWRERYQYTVANIKDRHQLVAAIDANDHETRYEYFGAGDSFPGQSAAPLPVHNEEYVRRVVEHPGNTAPVVTEFSYDLTDVLDLHWRSTVRDGRGIDALYVLNANGGDVERREALGSALEKTTSSDWAANDILRLRSIDDAGRVTRFGYDASGNLTSETIETADLGQVTRAWQYGPFNKLVRETDAAGRSRSWDVDPSNGDVVTITDQAGNRTRYEYEDGNHGLVAREIDPRGHVTVHTDHDSYGNARTLTGPGGRVATREYDSRGRLLGETDNLGHQVEQEWDGLDRLRSRARLAGPSGGAEAYAWEYYPGGQKRSETNPLGARTSFVLDGLDRVVLEEQDLGSESLAIERGYDANGNLISEKDRRGVSRAWRYDELNRAIEMRIASGPAPAPTGVVARYEYDTVGRKLFETDLAGLRTDFEHDGLYRITKALLPETCPYGRCFEEYRYDPAGNRTFLRDAGGFTETREYDGLDRVTSLTDRAGRTWVSDYHDEDGSFLNLSRTLDPFGLETRFTYDELNRETVRRASLLGGGGQGEVYTTTADHDDASHTVLVTDPRGSQTRRELDGLDRVLRQVVDVDGLGLETITKWDGLSNPTYTRDPEGHPTESFYDEAGRLTAIVDALGRRTEYTYDGNNRRTSETDRRSVRTEMTYDNLERLVRTSLVPSITGVTWSTGTSYLDAARKRVETDPRGKETVIELDGLGRVVRTIDPDGQETRTEWLGISDRRERDQRGFWRELRFDGIGRPTLARDPEPFQAQTFTTAYDDAGNRVTETDRRGIIRVTQKDPLQRLRSITRAGVLQEENGYDPNGNRVFTRDATGHETRFVYDAANRSTSRTEGFGTADAATTAFEHDRDGNVTLERDQRAADLGEPFSVRRTYDLLHRLATVTDGEGHTTEYGYDPEGHRTSVKEPGQQVTTFEYGEKGEIIAVTQPGGPGQSAPVTTALHDSARNPLRQTDARGHEVEMAWDDLGRLDRRTQKGAPEGDLVSDPAYDPSGNQTSFVDPNGQTVTQTFDELNRVRTKAWTFAPGNPDRPWRHTTSMTYTWDANNNLLRVDETVASGAAVATPTGGPDRRPEH